MYFSIPLKWIYCVASVVADTDLKPKFHGDLPESIRKAFSAAKRKCPETKVLQCRNTLAWLHGH